MRHAGPIAVGILAAALLAAAASYAAFTAQTLAGTWTGTWKNLRFKTAKGPFSIVITAPDADTIVVDASNASFGCGALATPVILKKGVDWNDQGARGTFATDPGNSIALSYDDAHHKLTGKGTNCHGSWKLTGKVKGKRFKGRSVTKVGGPAPSVVNARRQP